MPAGTPKVTMFGGKVVVPAGSSTFNSPGTFTVPVGVTKVNITGKGGSGNAGASGNSGQCGAGGAGGTGGYSFEFTFCNANFPGCPCICPITPYYVTNKTRAGGNRGLGGNGNSVWVNGGPNGNPGNTGAAGNTGASSSGLGYNFAGGAGGNAGNGGNGGTGGPRGVVPTCGYYYDAYSGSTFGSDQSGRYYTNGPRVNCSSGVCPGFSGTQGMGWNNCATPIRFGQPSISGGGGTVGPGAPPNTPGSTNFGAGGGGGGGAGTSNKGSTAGAGPGNTNTPNQNIVNRPGGAGGTCGGGSGGAGGYLNCVGGGSTPGNPGSPGGNANIGRAGGGGGGGSSSLSNTSNIATASGGGGGSRGNAGNPGNPGNPGSAANPSTTNCIPVTPGGSYPITVGSPGGQVTISWNTQ